MTQVQKTQGKANTLDHWTKLRLINAIRQGKRPAEFDRLPPAVQRELRRKARQGKEAKAAFLTPQ